MKSWKPEAIILAIGMLIMGYFIKNGLDTFAGKDRVVTVKGLAEMEVPANKVTWPLMYKEVGNDLPALYNKINNTNQTIVTFLKQKGITEQEISINAPELIDLQADRYNSNPIQFRYNITTVITVTSDKVELVRNLIKEQSELLKQGIAITGGDYRYNVQYDFTGLNAVKPQMIEEATKNARAAAIKFAKDSDSELGKIKRAYQGQFSIEDRVHREYDDISGISGIFKSFSDAPGGFKEELEEINYGLGAEYVYNDKFALRAGYHHESQSKGNRKYFTVGAGFKMNVFSLDAAYVVATAKSNPLDQTLRFTLSFDMDGLKDLFKR